jgi:hypothetical protein
MIRVIGFGLFAAAAACAIAAWYLDRRLQAFRLPDKSPSSYLLVPLRIRRDLYRADAHHLVNRAWWSIAAMCGLAFLGIILIASQP